MQKHQISLPVNLILMIKALVTAESVATSLDPDFKIIEALKPYIQKLITYKFSPKRYLQDMSETFLDFIKLFKILPYEVKTLFDKVRHGKLHIQFEHQGLERFITVMDRASNRFSFSIIIAAIIIGSSLIIHQDKGPMFLGVSFFGLIGYVTAGVMGFWLLVRIIRSRRF